MSQKRVHDGSPPRWVSSSGAVLLRSISWVGLLLVLFVFMLFGCGGGEQQIQAAVSGCEQCGDGHCLPNTNGLTGKCVECLTKDHCTDGEQCGRQYKCVCVYDTACPMNTKCDTASGKCVACRVSADCQDPEKKICHEQNCVPCIKGQKRACMIDGVTSCGPGIQVCTAANQWGPCEDLVFCSTNEECVEKKCQPICPKSACKPGETTCTSGTGVLPGALNTCVQEEGQCPVWKSRECPARQICEGGTCKPVVCPKVDCTDGDFRCITDENGRTTRLFEVCERSPLTGCLAWSHRKSCALGLCLANAGKSHCGCRRNSDCGSGGAVCNAQGQCAKCTADADCGGGRLCFEGVCQPADCRENADCALGQICRDRFCGSCQSDADCGDKAICTKKSCVKVECKISADCRLGKICRAYKCSPCLRDDDCGAADYYCYKGQCELGCANSSDCATGQVCVNLRCQNKR